MQDAGEIPPHPQIYPAYPAGAADRAYPVILIDKQAYG